MGIMCEVLPENPPRRAATTRPLITDCYPFELLLILCFGGRIALSSLTVWEKFTVRAPSPPEIIEFELLKVLFKLTAPTRCTYYGGGCGYLC